MLPEPALVESSLPVRTDVSRWEERLWEAELDYEVRALKLVTRCVRAGHNRLLCGDKSGQVTAFHFDGKRAWTASPREDAGHRLLGGPVYDLAVVHPLEDATELLDPEQYPCLVSVGAGNSELTFLDYLSGEPVPVEVEESLRTWLDLKSSVLSLLYVESLRELWAGLASGRIARLGFEFEGRTVRARQLSSLDLGEAVSALCFMPRGLARSGKEYRKGWICAATMLGNVYSLDPLSAPFGQERLLQATGPIRSCVSLSWVAAKHGWEGRDVFAVAYGGSVKYFAREWPQEGRPAPHESVLDWPCADRVFCLSWADLEDAVWLVVGANDKRLHLCRIMSKEGAEEGRSPSYCFGDKRFSIRLPERVREVAVREVGTGDGEAGANLYVALGNHQIQALHLLPRHRFREQIQVRLPAGDLKDILAWLSRSPYDPALRRNVVALLFRAGWLSDYLQRHTLDDSQKRCLRLIVYHLLAGSGPLICREVQSGILDAENHCKEFRVLATEFARHIGKYCLDGLSFSDKTQNLDRLAEFNEQNDRDYLYDAAIYRSLLAERRHTEKEVFKLDAPVTSLQAVDLPRLGGRRLLATSYHEGIAWLIEKGANPRLKFQAGQAEWLQQVMVWTDPSSSAQHAIFFYRNQGWTSRDLDCLEPTQLIPLPEPRPVAGDKNFYIYSFQELPGGATAVGGRHADVKLLRISAAHDRKLDLRLAPSMRTGDESYAPVRALCFHSLIGDTGELFAGCDNGTCYRLFFDGTSLGNPHPIYQLPGSIRVLATRGTNHLFVGDTSDAVVLLRRLPTAEASRDVPSFIPEWIARLNGAAITGAIEAALQVPSKAEPGGSPETRKVFVVSDSLGKFHVLRLDKVREHSFAELLVTRGSSQIEQLVLFPPEDPAEAENRTQVAVACFDQIVLLRLLHRRESVHHLNEDLTRAAIATLRAARPDLPQTAFEKAVKTLRTDLDEHLFVPEVVQRVARSLASASAGGQELARLEEGVWGAFNEVAWKLASVNVRSESTTVMSLRLRYDDPEALGRLLDQLAKLSSGTMTAPDGKRPHLRLRYCLRFAFKIIKHLLASEEPPSPPLRTTLAHFVHLCHDLCKSWGPAQSDDELRCKLDISHMLFRFASRRTLECLLGRELDAELQVITGKTMGYFLQELLLNDPRLAIPFRTVQHIRQMVYHDEEAALQKPIEEVIVPLLVDRFRQCKGTHHDAWLFMEIYLCLCSIEERYDYSQWRLVSKLLEDGCSLTLLELLAERQQVLPPRDLRCRKVVEALNRAVGVSVGDPRVVVARLTVFDDLSRVEGRPGILACVRILTAVAIAFDSSSDPILQIRAHEAIAQAGAESISLPPSVSRAEVEQLLDCARGLIKLTEGPSSEERGKIYHRLRTGLDRLLALRPLGAAQVGLLESDVIRKIFLEGRELVRRQIEIEFDFVAPLRFLQEQSFAEDEVADEQMLARKLLTYAALHGDLSRSRKTLLLTKDATAKVVVLDVLGEQRSHEALPSRAQIRRRLEALLPPPMHIDLLKQEATRLLDSEPATGSTPQLDLLELGPDSLGEIIPIDREGERYGLLFFVYDPASAPDPSKRALSRMVPQFLMIEFMRSIQTERLRALTFHHIGAPISAMRAMLKALTAGYIDPDEQEKYFENLWLMAEDCRLMIENHQNYLRMVRGIAPPVQPRRFDIAAEAEFRRKIVHYKYKGSQQTVRWSATPEPLDVYLDSMMVGDIIQNLLDNACKYSPARSEIRISVWGSKNKRDVFIEVGDQGPGLPEQVSASLYGEGIRGEAATQSTRPGLGLGLFMVHRYVEWLDGEVWYDSSPKNGTTFTVRLPKEDRH